MREAGGYTGPNDEPGWNGNAKMSGSEGFYLGCRWIFSAKDIPVPEEVKEGWEKLLHSARIENEGKRQNILAQWRLQWQKEEFRRRLEQNDVMAKGAIKSPFDGTTCQCNTCGFLVLNTVLGPACPVCFDGSGYCLYCVGYDEQGNLSLKTLTQYSLTPDGERSCREALQRQLAACNCDHSAGECGRFIIVDSQAVNDSFCCCRNWWGTCRCDQGKRAVHKLECKTESTGDCPPDQRCVLQNDQTTQHECIEGTVTYTNCCSCCDPGECAPPSCGSGCEDNNCKCTINNTRLYYKTLPQWVCVG